MAFSVGILWLVWSIDRYNNASPAAFQTAGSIGDRIRSVFNGAVYDTFDKGSGNYELPAACAQALDNGSGGVNFQILKIERRTCSQQEEKGTRPTLQSFKTLKIKSPLRRA